MPILLLPLRNTVSLHEALEASTANPVVVADCYVEGAERWQPVEWGWRTVAKGREIFNVDHHAEDARFYCPISSGNLAVRYVDSHGVLAAQVPAIINHTDCDSIISAAILTGLLPPEQKFCDAVIAADHTGDPNPIADLLQALDPLRDVEFSLHSLNLLLHNEPLDERALRLIKKRHEERARAGTLVESGKFQMLGSVAVAKLTAAQRVSGEFLPALLPGAMLVISGSPMENGRWEIKVRLGKAAAPGTTLFSLGVRGIDPAFSGRWNAGSTKRAGGSRMDPISFARQLSDRAAVANQVRNQKDDRDHDQKMNTRPGNVKNGPGYQPRDQKDEEQN